MLTKSNKYTVTVGIPAYNEEANIASLLFSLLAQKGTFYTLEKIIVLGDGCTDGTERIVKTLATKYPVISWLADGKRLGNKRRINQLYQMNESDFIITFDGDTLLSNSYVIEEIVRVFDKDSQACVVAANQVAVQPDNFIGKIIYFHYFIWDNIRILPNNGEHIHNLQGAGTALRKEFAKSIHFPAELTSGYAFLYVMAYKRNGFRLAKEAVILYRPAGTIQDFRHHIARGVFRNKQLLAQYFGDWVYDLYYIPRRYKVQGIWHVVMSSPFLSVASLALGLLLRFVSDSDMLSGLEIWAIVGSTKKMIPPSRYAHFSPTVMKQLFDTLYAGNLTFTVGIPTCYGGPSLLATVKRVRASKGVGSFRFIVVADRTPIEPAIRKELKRLGVELIWNNKEGSQFKKIKQIVAMCESDILVITQDDITFESRTLATITKTFSARPELTMVGARVLPLAAKTVIETILSSMVRIVDYITTFWNDDNYLMASGRCFAFRTQQIKKFRIPEGVINGDMFLYLENKRLLGSFARPQEAIVYIRCPQRLKDQIGPSSRYQYSEQEMAKYFNFPVAQEYRIPLGAKMRAAAKEFFAHPFAVLGYGGVFLYTRIRRQSVKIVSNPVWNVDTSTKQ